MLGLKIQTGYLDLNSDTKATFQLNNPAMSDGNDVGLAVMPFSFPDTPNNRKKLGFLNLSNVYKKLRSFDAELYFNGLLVAIGKLVITEVNNVPGGGSYEAFLSINGFAADILDKDLRSLDWPVFITGSTAAAVVAHANSKLTADPANVYCFAPLKQQNFYGDTNPHFYDPTVTILQRGGIVNGWDFVAQSFKQNVIPNSGSYLANHSLRFNKETLVPYVYLHYILRFVFGNFGYNLKGDFMDDNALAKLCLFNSFALDRKDSTEYLAKAVHTTPQSIPASFGFTTFDTLVIDNETEDAQNCYDPTTGFYSPGSAGNHTANVNLTITFPVGNIGDGVRVQVRVGTHILHQEDLFYTGSNPVYFSWTGEFYVQPTEVGTPFFSVEASAQIVSPEVEAFVECTELLVKATDAPQLNQYANKIELKNHVPDITIAGLLDILKTFFTLSFDFDFGAKTCSINLCKNVLGKRGVKRFTEKTSRQNLLRLSDPKGVKMSFPFDGEEYQPDEAPDTSQYNYRGAYLNYAAIEAIPNPQANDTALNLAMNWLYVCSYDTNFNAFIWSRLTHNYYPYSKGNNYVDKIPGASPLLTDYWGNSLQNYMLPFTAEEGTSAAFNRGDGSFSVKLGFYEGLQPDSNGDLYPMLTALSRQTDGTPIGPYSLRWDEPGRGLFDAFMLSWYLFLQNTEEKEADLLMSLPEFRAFQFSTNVEIQGVRYVVKQLNAELSNQGLSLVKALLYRVLL